jgi:ankyrin repeat protein
MRGISCLGRTALFFGASAGFASIVAQLIECVQVDVNASNNKGATPLIIAAQGKHYAVVNMLVECEAEN